MLRDDGKLDAHEYELYTRWLGHLDTKSPTRLAGLIFIDTHPEVCSQRIAHRNRDGEDGIPLSYLQQLELYQARWIDGEDIPCIRTNCVDEISEFVDRLLDNL
jgi:deoxyadenosine/deoxycytidine kinase